MLFDSDPAVNMIATRMAEGAFLGAIRKLRAAAERMPPGSRQRRQMREAADALGEMRSDWRLDRESLCPHTWLPIEGGE